MELKLEQWRENNTEERELYLDDHHAWVRKCTSNRRIKFKTVLRTTVSDPFLVNGHKIYYDI